MGWAVSLLPPVPPPGWPPPWDSPALCWNRSAGEDTLTHAPALPLTGSHKPLMSRRLRVLFWNSQTHLPGLEGEDQGHPWCVRSLDCRTGSLGRNDKGPAVAEAAATIVIAPDERPERREEPGPGGGRLSRQRPTLPAAPHVRQRWREAPHPRDCRPHPKPAPRN